MRQRSHASTRVSDSVEFPEHKRQLTRKSTRLQKAFQSSAFLAAAWVAFVLIGAAVFSRECWHWLSEGESRSTTIRNLGLVVAAVVGLPLAFWRSFVAERQAETAHRGLLNERYQKGAEMLSSRILPVCLGGIYALERLAREKPSAYHVQIMGLLCAFIRNPPRVDDGHSSRPPEHLRAVIAAIRRRSEAQIEAEEEDEYRLNLFEADLTNADLTNTNLSFRVGSQGQIRASRF